METKSFILDAIQVRLRMLVPYLDRWPQAMGIMSLPPNVPVALANLLTLVDDICHYSGDRSVDVSNQTIPEVSGQIATGEVASGR